MRVAVLGPGGVGGFVAAALHRAGTADVVLVAREATAAAIAQRPGGALHVASRALGAEFDAPVTVATAVDGDIDVLVVATKHHGLQEALDRVHAEPALVLPLLNGLDHLPALRERFMHVAASVIRIESDRPAPGVIVQTSPVARIDADREVPGAFARAGFDVRTGASEADVLWGKLCRLCALATTTTAFGVPLGEVRDDPRRRTALHGAIAECVATARAEGATTDEQQTREELDAAPATLGSSMWRDLQAGRPLELDAIAGAVVRRARAHGIPTPTLDYLVRRIIG